MYFMSLASWHSLEAGQRRFAEANLLLGNLPACRLKVTVSVRTIDMLDDLFM